MPQFRVLGFDFEGSIIVGMRLIIHLYGLPVKIDVTTIEVDDGVVRILFQGLVKILFCFLELVEMVMCKASVVVVDR